MTFAETKGPYARMMFVATKGLCARTIFDETNGKVIAMSLGEMIAMSLGEMIAGGMIMNSVLEETKMLRESVFGTSKRKKCANGVVVTKTMGKTKDLERKPLIPRYRGIFLTRTANLTGNVQVTDGHREVVVNPRSVDTSIGKRIEMAETTVVKSTTVPEETETEVVTAVEEMGMQSPRKVGIEVNESWIGARGTKTAFETIVGRRQDEMIVDRRQDRTVQVLGRMVQRHHLVEETALLLPKVEGTVIHLKGISATMGVSQAIGVASLFGTSDTLHLVALALLHHVAEGIVIVVKVMGRL
jgi:hypothetical protein